QLAGGFAAAVGREAAPVEGVIPGLRGVVEHPARGLANDVFEVHVREVGALDHLVEVVHVSLVVLAVVVFQRLGGNVRCQRVAVVGQRRKFDRHGSCSLRDVQGMRLRACYNCGLGATPFSIVAPTPMDINERIKATLSEHPIVLYMKGTPQFPMCGFSARTSQALAAAGAEYFSVNVL